MTEPSADMPEMEIAPKSILQLAIPSDPMYTIETPTEIRQKLTDMANDYSGGSLGEEDADESGLLRLTGIELHTRPDVSPEPYELLVHPKLIGFVKTVHPNYWKDQLRLAKESNDEWKAAEAHGNVADQLPAPLRGLVEGLTGGAVITSSAGKGMTAEEFAEGGAHTECCCGHKAEKHQTGDELGGCTECRCGRFHTHT